MRLLNLNFLYGLAGLRSLVLVGACVRNTGLTSCVVCEPCNRVIAVKDAKKTSVDGKRGKEENLRSGLFQCTLQESKSVHTPYHRGRITYVLRFHKVKIDEDYLKQEPAVVHKLDVRRVRIEIAH